MSDEIIARGPTKSITIIMSIRAVLSFLCLWCSTAVARSDGTTTNNNEMIQSDNNLPHIFYFLVDDLGYANVGFNAAAPKEPITPHIDSLAASGLILDNYYTYKFCSPTRSSFMSGRLPIHVNQQNHPPEYPGKALSARLYVCAHGWLIEQN